MQFPNPKLNDRFRALTVGRIAVGVLGAAILATGAIGATSHVGSRFLELPFAHAADEGVPQNLVALKADEGVPQNLVALKADEGVPQNLVALRADEGVPQNLVALKADEGVPQNLVLAMAADEGVPPGLVTA